VQDAAGRTLSAAQERHAGKGGVALKISGGCQQPQWPAPGLPFVFGIGLPVRHRRQTLRRERGDVSAPSSQHPGEISDCDILDSATAVLYSSNRT
jgi:hypothetical protein